MIFVFGSNVEGRHGKGAAKEALENHGAVYGVGYGRQGNSFAIPTKWTPYKRMNLETIQQFVILFLHYAETHPNETFYITPLGCGLAGYSPKEIAPFFLNAPSNCILSNPFLEELNENKHT